MKSELRSASVALAPTELLFQEHFFTLETRPNDLDVLGHVNNAIALEYLEAARWNWATGLGLVWLGNIVVVVSRIEIDYLEPILSGWIALKTKLEPMPPDWLEDDTYRLTVHQSIFEGDSAAELVRARVSLAFVDTSTQRLCTLQDCWRARTTRDAAGVHAEKLSRIARRNGSATSLLRAT